MLPTTVTESMDNEGEHHNPTTGEASRLKKKGRKTALTFKLQPATDHERVWDGRVVENRSDDRSDDHQGEIDGLFSVKNPLQETATYDLDAILGRKDPVTNPGRPDEFPVHMSMTERVNKPLPGAPAPSDTLSDEGYVPVSGFRPHPAFGSLNNPSSTPRQQSTARGGWRQPPVTTEETE
ncbi:hypothetical protein ARMGADRAFT_1009549 [Armillaria gallica]|uniref:Uncharacterized protein n=1 Tax=Armillaria gallica TaxID=47427 RepID=A0A2H3DQQ7_ARMGA|nr:hypothetical protein ARMGADRAFT_1009549 [Armillaria gallica]